MLENRQVDIEECDGQCKAKTIDQVQDPADPGQQVAGILHTQASFQNGLGEIAHHRGEGEKKSEDGNVVHTSHPCKVVLSEKVGSEGPGLSPELIERCDQKVTIPMHHDTDSLNVAVAAGVCLYHFTQPERSKRSR